MIPNCKEFMKAFCGGMECVTAIAVTKWNDGTKGGGLTE